MPEIVLAAPAKLNLFLHVTGKREDGYHLLESLIAFTEFGDRLMIRPGEALGLKVIGPFAQGLASEDNLVLKAAKLLQTYADIEDGAQILLHKHTPVAAGLGGGSSDAAVALMGLAQLWDIDLSPDDLYAMALELGSDVPVCLAQLPAWVSGIGEQIDAVDIMAGVYVLLVNPGMRLATADVFKHYSGPFSASRSAVARADSFDALIAAIEPCRNDLEPAAIALCPPIADVLAALNNQRGCALARMSGSGATCFGLFSRPEDIQDAAAAIVRDHPNWWCLPTGLMAGVWDEA